MPSDRHSEDAEDVAAPPAARRGFVILRVSLRLAAAAVMIAAICHLAPPAPPPAAPIATLEPFVPSAVPASPPPALGTARLALSEPGIDPVRVSPGRLDPATGLREDTLSRGTFEAIEAPALRLTVTRGAEAGRAPSLFVLLARRAAGGPALAVLRTGGYGRIATKFGAVETLDVTLGGRLQRTCTGFVTRDAALRIDGWLCAPLGRAPEPRMLACTLDALSLEDPADPAAAAIFRTAEARRSSACDRPSVTADPAARTGSIAGRPARSKK